MLGMSKGRARNSRDQVGKSWWMGTRRSTGNEWTNQMRLSRERWDRSQLGVCITGCYDQLGARAF